MLKTKDIPDVQIKILGLIQKWGINFEEKRNVVPNFSDVYQKLKRSGVQFPSGYESNYPIFTERSRDKYDDESKKGYYDNQSENSESAREPEEGGKYFYIESLKNKLKIQNFEHKYRRLVAFLVKMHENIQIANLMLDNREVSGLKEVLTTLRNGNNTLIDTISGGRLKDEKLMEITLGTTEDINQTLSREEDKRNGYKPKTFTSYFILNNVVPIKNNCRTRPRSEKKRRNPRRDKDYDDGGYNKDRYKQKIQGNDDSNSKVKNADDIFDLFSTSNPQNNQGNRQPLDDFFANPNNQFNFNNQGRQLQNNPIIMNMNNKNDLFRSQVNPRINPQINNNNNLNMFGNNQFQSNNQPKSMSNFDILEQKLNALSLGQSNNFQNQTNLFNTFVNSNNNNNNIKSNNNRFDLFGPSPEINSNQLVPYLGPSLNQNNMNQNTNNFLGNQTSNQNQFNNFGQNTQMTSNQNINLPNQNNLFKSQATNNMGNNNMGNNLMNFNTNTGNGNTNPNNNFNFNSQQMTFEEMEKQQKLKELDDLF